MKLPGRHRKMALGAILAGTFSGVLLGTSPNVAFGNPHEERIVGNGKYELAVGFRQEPAFEDVDNAFDLFVSRASDGAPINTSAGDVVDLTVEVQLRATEAFHSEVIQSAMLDKPRKAFGFKNRYNAWFKPTIDATYAFHITGTISDASNPVAGPVTIDETFVCGKGSLSPDDAFGCVRDPQIFPVGPKDKKGKDRSGYEDNDNINIFRK